MPYISKAKQASAHWVSIPDAIKHICAADKCVVDDAKIQLLAALTDGALCPLKWQDEIVPSISASTMTVPMDTPPQKGADWRSADIDWDAGTILDLWGEYKFKERRVLLLPALRVSQSWPIADHLTSKAESQAVKILTEHLRAEPDLKKDDAKDLLKNQEVAVSMRGFQDRVWPQARIKAGLEPTARAGRKRGR